MTIAPCTKYDLLIRNALIIDGSGGPEFVSDVLVHQGKIVRVGTLLGATAKETIDATGLCLAPGFIDVHSHDDINLIKNPMMQAKVSQGVTTVVVGNCGISASPINMQSEPPDPMNLLGQKEDFSYSSFADYAGKLAANPPHTNVAALVGHTTLRANVMEDLSKPATPEEIQAMQRLLRQSLCDGAIGLSSGLAYQSAINAPPDELVKLMPIVAEFNGLYVTHLRDEFDGIVTALQEAFDTAASSKIPLVVSHVKCAGKQNWGRAEEVVNVLSDAAKHQPVACDCYPYSASSSTLDLNQVTDEIDIFISWSTSHPEMAEQTLKEIAESWQLSLIEAAEKLQPAGAVYHCMSEADVETFLSYPLAMVGSDGLPGTPSPHPRLWGTFPRVLKHYCKERKLFDLATAIHKMSGLSAEQFGFADRGVIAEGNWADLVMFDIDTIADTATFSAPIQAARGIYKVWVNGQLTYSDGEYAERGCGKMINRQNKTLKIGVFDD